MSLEPDEVEAFKCPWAIQDVWRYNLSKGADIIKGKVLMTHHLELVINQDWGVLQFKKEELGNVATS
jgi:hypothetical protein